MQNIPFKSDKPKTAHYDNASNNIVWYSYSDIIDEEDQSELSMIRSTLSWSYFRIGDIALKYIKGNARKNALRVPSERIYEAIGYFVGRTARTVRYYAENSTFFPDDVRESYKELPFSYFDLARSFGDYWQDVLDYALDNMTMNFETISRNCRQMYIASTPIVEKEEIDEKEDDIISPENPYENTLCALPTKEISTSARDQERALALVNSLSDLADRIARLSSMLDLPDEPRIQLDDSLKGLRSVIPTIVAFLK